MLIVNSFLSILLNSNSVCVRGACSVDLCLQNRKCARTEKQIDWRFDFPDELPTTTVCQNNWRRYRTVRQSESAEKCGKDSVQNLSVYALLPVTRIADVGKRSNECRQFALRELQGSTKLHKVKVLNDLAMGSDSGSRVSADCLFTCPFINRPTLGIIKRRKR